MKRPLSNILLYSMAILMLLGFPSCSGFIGELVANRIVEKLNRIDHYQAEIRMLGANKSLVSLYYKKFWHIHQEVIEPRPSKGEVFIFDGDRFLFFSPASKVAFLITGIKEPTLEEWKRFMKQRMARSKETTLFKKEGKDSILGRKATLYRSSPKRENSILPLVTLTWIDDATRLPLKVVQYRPDGSVFKGFEHTHIDFDTPLSSDAFHPTIGQDTKVIRWDLQKKTFSKYLGEELVRPRHLPKGLSLLSLSHSSQAPEMWLAHYENRPLFLLFGQWPEGHVPLPFSGGSPLWIDGREVRLLYYSGLHLVHFKRKARQIVLLSNLTLNDLLGIQWTGEVTAASLISMNRPF